MPESETDLERIMAIVRRYLSAVAQGRIDARRVDTLTDIELAELDDELAATMADKQREAEDLAAA